MSSETQFTVNGKTAIATGAGSGIGLAFTALLLSRGCNVVLVDLSLRPEAQSLITKHSTTSPKAIFVQTDRLDIVCPCAGIYEPYSSNFWHPPDSSPFPTDKIDESRYATLDVNIVHPIRVTQMALGYWVNSSPSPAKLANDMKPRRIIHVSSIAAQIPVFATPPYGASKAAISDFVRAMGPLDEQINVRVNAVAPGIVKTPLWTAHPEKMAFVEDEKEVWASPEEVARAMLLCVEGGGELVGGTVLEVGKGHLRVVGLNGDPGPDLNPENGNGLGISSGRKGAEGAITLRWLREDGWGLPRHDKV